MVPPTTIPAPKAMATIIDSIVELSTIILVWF